MPDFDLTPEEQDALDQFIAMQSAGAPVAAPAEPPAAPPIAARLRPTAVEPAMMMPAQQPERRYVLPEPPMREPPNKGMAILAAFADLAINKGRGGPQILKPLIDDQTREYENYQRQVQHMQAQAALDRGGARAIDPMGQRLAWARIAQSERRLRNAEDAAAAKAEQERELGEMDSEATKRVREGAIAAGYDPAEMAKLTGAQILKFRPQLGQEAAQVRAFQQQGTMEDVRQGNRQALLDQQLKAREDAAQIERQTKREAETRAFQEKFAKDRELELDIAGLVEDIEAAPGGAPPEGFFERFRNAITARGIDPERLEGWQAKQMVLELWARNQTGAAISKSEDGRFITQVGMDPTASADQVEAAYRVLRRIVSRRLRGYASSDREAAMGVANEYGLDVNAWFGPEPKQQQRRRKAPPAPSAAPEPLEDEPTEDDLEGL